MEFKYARVNDGYYLPSRGMSNPDGELNAPAGFNRETDIEKPILRASEIGTTVVELPGRQDLIKAAEAAIKFGVSSMELATGQGGPTQPVGVESYGKEAREALREMAKANQVTFTSVHTPSSIPNLSGFNPQQGFVEELRKQALDEVEKGIEFAADVAGGGAVVIHTGEFTRPVSDAEWAKETMPDGTQRYKFLGYAEEPGRSNTYMVDKRTGKVVQDIKKSNIIREPLFLTAKDFRLQHKDVATTRQDGSPIHDDDWVTVDGQYIDPSDNEQLFQRVPKWDPKGTKFETVPLAWKDVEKRTEWYNKQVPEDKRLSPEEMAFKINITNQILQAKGSSLFYGRYYEESLHARDKIKEALAYYERVEKELGKEEAWKLMKSDPVRAHAYTADLVSPDQKTPTQILKHALEQEDNNLRHIHEASAAADARAAELQDTLKHTTVIEDYALEQTRKSIAEAGIKAMDQTKNNPHAKRDIFVAPENIFPETYGSHPDELIRIIKESRQEMVKFLTSPTIKDPHARIDSDGKVADVKNPYFMPGVSEQQAMKEAEKHIRATFDTEHLALWRKKFTARPGETIEQTDKRFEEWWIEQMKKVSEANIVGHVHMVDSWDGGHGHIPAGQGKLPLTKWIKYLKDKNPSATIVSEGHSENARFGVDRQITSAWRAFGVNIRGGDTPFMQGGGFGAPYRFDDVYRSYFNQMQSPYFVFGAYAPSNDWTLWSQVPLE